MENKTKKQTDEIILVERDLMKELLSTSIKNLTQEQVKLLPFIVKKDLDEK